MRLIALSLPLLFAGPALAQCPPSASAGWGARVTVQFAPPAPPPAVEYRFVPAPPPAVAEYRYLPAAPVPAVPVYAAVPAPRVEYRYGPFGRLRRVVVNN